ncbi:MAG: helix-turn-helix domain-containing protein [Paracoccaceae bacterium]
MAKKYAHIDWRGLKALRLKEIDATTLEPLKQETIAAAAGMDQSYYSRLEKGKVTSPREEYIDALARIFKVTPHQLLDELPKKDPTKSAPSDLTDATPAPTVNINIPIYETPCNLTDFKYTGGVLVDQWKTIQSPPTVQNVRKAYAVKLPTNENSPKYMQGDVVYVNPEADVVGSDDVVVQLHYTDHTILLVRKCVRVEPFWSDDEADEPEPGYDLCTHTEFAEWLFGNEDLPPEVPSPLFDRLINVMEMFPSNVNMFDTPDRTFRRSQIGNSNAGLPERIDVHVIVSSDNGRFGHGKSKFEREREEKEANLQKGIASLLPDYQPTKRKDG